MRNAIHILLISVTFVFAIGCGSSSEEDAEKTSRTGTENEMTNDGERLKPISVSRIGALTVYEDKELTRPVVKIFSDDIFFVDSIQNEEHSVVYITSENGLSGYVDPENTVEVRASYAAKLNVRDKPSTSGKILDVLEQGEPVFIVQKDRKLQYPEYEDGIGWREIHIGNSTGWVADEYLIEKRFYDILEPALERYEAGDSSGMIEYLENVSSRYDEVESSIASDSKTATVLFDYYENSEYAIDDKCLFIIGKSSTKFYSGEIYDSCLSPEGKYTYIHSGYSIYQDGGGYSITEPVEIFDNRTGDIVYTNRTNARIFYYENNENTSDLIREFIDDRYLLLVVLDSSLLDMREDREDYRDFYPYLIMIDLLNGSETILLEPDFSTLDGVSVKMKRTPDLDISLDQIKKAMEMSLFKLCEREILTGAWNEG